MERVSREGDDEDFQPDISRKSIFLPVSELKVCGEPRPSDHGMGPRVMRRAWEMITETMKHAMR